MPRFAEATGDRHRLENFAWYRFVLPGKRKNEKGDIGGMGVAVSSLSQSSGLSGDCPAGWRLEGILRGHLKGCSTQDARIAVLCVRLQARGGNRLADQLDVVFWRA